jgi:hypothetical protein
VTNSEIQTLLLKILAAGGDSRLGGGHAYLAERVQAAAPPGQGPGAQDIMAGVWSLISQGLAFIDYSQSAPENWDLRLTESGRAVVADKHPNPDDPAGYLTRLRASDGLSTIVLDYATEALHAYNARLYRAAAVMIGVASEAAVLQAAQGLARFLHDAERKQYLEQLQSPKLNTVAKFQLFQQKMRSHVADLPPKLTEGVDLTVHSVGDLLRTFRNDAGHPTGVAVMREDAFTLLQMFVRYATRLALLKP